MEITTENLNKMGVVVRGGTISAALGIMGTFYCLITNRGEFLETYRFSRNYNNTTLEGFIKMAENAGYVFNANDNSWIAPLKIRFTDHEESELIYSTILTNIDKSDTYIVGKDNRGNYVIKFKNLKLKNWNETKTEKLEKRFEELNNLATELSFKLRNVIPHRDDDWDSSKILFSVVGKGIEVF